MKDQNGKISKALLSHARGGKRLHDNIINSLFPRRDKMSTKATIYCPNKGNSICGRVPQD